jgi:hypothetical protein
VADKNDSDKQRGSQVFRTLLIEAVTIKIWFAMLCVQNLGAKQTAMESYTRLDYSQRLHRTNSTNHLMTLPPILPLLRTRHILQLFVL